ncbi:glycoside hydrolase family 130 protein [Asticcacaulis sp. EMRT-3]|uniref:glycoside hydrolase family 130 protein n=1 Tax=Asticcacaulis sp. EMRT-3 TaxID=3040349 RepID=UPI0024AEF282|nr:glycoside hydrolase family 130 protein [Asticcacaulis sp. EMRT-3]MDI7775957.1 glycoside hydrolase family 130 protein [Asticcacaulis sp. EMRT-3]
MSDSKSDGALRRLTPMQISPVMLRANADRVVILPFSISINPRDSAMGAMSRVNRVCQAIAAMSADQVRDELEMVNRDFTGRHWQTRGIFLERFRQIKEMNGGLEGLDEDHMALVGAYFCHEYSYQAAAVMNPSVVPHPDQTGANGGTNFIMSTRTVGEGHISTISFREGTFHKDGTIVLKPEADYAVAAKPAHHAPLDGAVTVQGHQACPISETVLFPVTRAQTNGLEDLRMVMFRDEVGATSFMGTYTAYNGREIACECFETSDFRSFRLTPFVGAASQHKGLAFFPRKLNDRWAAIGRLDHESIFYLESDDKYSWNNGERLMGPEEPWELIQLGNCGSPIELDEGWLVLTHGVGAVRRYSLGAALLDKDNPRIVLARSKEPLLSPSEDNREGYVPNVIYTCGAMRCGEWIFMPYGVADSSIHFASIRISDLLAHLGVTPAAKT